MIVVVKIGSSSLVDARGQLDAPTLARIASDIAGARAAGTSVILVTSGAIASGLGRLDIAERPTDLPSLQAASAVGQGELLKAWGDACAAHGIAVGQVLLTTNELDEPNARTNVLNTFSKLLEWGVLPVVNENDTVATDEISFGDNDTLAARVALLVGANMLVLLTDVDGIYDRPPDAPGAVRLQQIDDIEHLQAVDSSGDGSSWGTGGMRSKIVAATLAHGGGVATVVASADEQNAIVRSTSGDVPGTHVISGYMQ